MDKLLKIVLHHNKILDFNQIHYYILLEEK
jgi:hypothetical protein